MTLFHWDLPDELDKRYGGPLNKAEFAADFGHYARTVFAAIPKVKHWITFNEPWCSAVLGYNTGLFAPGHTSDRSKSKVGDSSRECWIVGHSLLLAHGTAVKIYREEFKAKDGGEIGITLNGISPFSPSPSLMLKVFQATQSTPGTQKIQPTSKPQNANSSSQSPGSQTPSTSDTTRPAWSNNSGTVSQPSLRKKPLW